MAAHRFRFSFFAFALAGIALGAPLASFAATPASNFNGDIQWRLIGPFRGGWGTMAQGIPDQPNVHYFSSAGGGVWKTIDAGRTWQSLGDDLTVEAPTPLLTAMLGGETPVPTPDGKRLLLTIKPETQNGQVFRLAGKGMPHLKGEGAGNLMARIQVVLPTRLNAKEKQLFEELAKQRAAS